MKRIALGLGIVVAVLAGCGGEFDRAVEGRGRPQSAAAVGERLQEASAGQAPAEGTLATFAADSPDRYLIKNAAITLDAEDVPATVQRVVEAARAVNGYVGDLRESTDGLGRVTASVTIRVPQQSLDGTILQIEGLGRIVDRQITSEDVTEEYLDTEARLRNLKRTEERLLDHLSRSAELEDILKAEQEIGRVRGEVERLEGRMRYLQHRVAYSTLVVTITEAPRTLAAIPPEGYSTGKTFGDASRALIALLRSLWTLLVWIAVWSVIWLPLLGVFWYALRRARRRGGLGTTGEDVVDSR